MKLSEARAFVIKALEADTVFDGVPILDVTASDFDHALHAAAKDPGAALAVLLDSGRPKDPRGDGASLYLTNVITVAVLVNPAANRTGKGVFELVERVLETLQAQSDQPGLRNALVVDTPAFEMGPLDMGLTVYFANFLLTTLNR